MKAILERFLREDDGQTTTEYVLILAVVVTIFMQFRKHMLGIMKKLFTDLDSKTDNLICTTDDCP